MKIIGKSRLKTHIRDREQNIEESYPEGIGEGAEGVYYREDLLGSVWRLEDLVDAGDPRSLPSLWGILASRLSPSPFSTSLLIFFERMRLELIQTVPATTGADSTDASKEKEKENTYVQDAQEQYTGVGVVSSVLYGHTLLVEIEGIDLLSLFPQPSKLSEMEVDFESELRELLVRTNKNDNHSIGEHPEKESTLVQQFLNREQKELQSEPNSNSDQEKGSPDQFGFRGRIRTDFPPGGWKYSRRQDEQPNFKNLTSLLREVYRWRSAAESATDLRGLRPIGVRVRMLSQNGTVGGLWGVSKTECIKGELPPVEMVIFMWNVSLMGLLVAIVLLMVAINLLCGSMLRLLMIQGRFSLPGFLQVYQLPFPVYFVSLRGLPWLGLSPTDTVVDTANVNPVPRNDHPQ
eukprot:TRINITY_DN2036_c0_g1_i1.p1 TRINITY_DN2036_c0_g1~~TRINITY_DN2036_c0_g1_i1.p1  ORF type:complete len:405 (-),score=67.87 TRINITY_DN2036_c0_g1_i1:44-1258(-)